jgi:hypothetical protein
MVVPQVGIARRDARPLRPSVRVEAGTAGDDAEKVGARGGRTGVGGDRAVGEPKEWLADGADHDQLVAGLKTEPHILIAVDHSNLEGRALRFYLGHAGPVVDCN